MKKLVVPALLIVLVAFGMLVADSAAKKREFTGSIGVQVFEKDATGQWKLTDELNASGIRFVSSVAEVAAGKKNVSSDFNFTGTTKKGHSLTVRLKPGGKGDVDLTTGFLGLELPFSIAINGKNADSTLKMTTDSVQGANGPVNGRRAKINKDAHSADLALVGSVTIQSPIFISGGTSFTPATADQAAEQKGQKAAERAESRADSQKSSQLLLVVKGDGTLKALN